MIPVALQPEPAKFDEKVRKPGHRWLAEKCIPLDEPPPSAANLPDYWRHVQRDLWKAYRGICAYLCIYFDWPLGAYSTDHFVAKSRSSGHAYEWANYRLSCMGMNRNKNRFDDILDPFEIKEGTFVLNLTSGEIMPNAHMLIETQELAWATIRRLRLADAETNEMRAKHYGYYCAGDVSADYLERHSPFVWFEAKRQGLL